MLEVGKLYPCSEYFIMLYPDKESAAAVPAAAAAAAAVPAAGAAAGAAVPAAAYWNRKLGKPVNSQTPLLVLSVNEKYVEVLAGDKKGWIINMDWLNIKELSCTRE
jgi:hypothetical protein